MKTVFTLIVSFALIAGCNNDKKEIARDPKIMLRADTLNSIKLTDTLIIYEHVCRACAYEESTHFDIADTSGIIKLEKIVTTNNNPPDVDGGSISKDLILVPVKTGTTTIKVYKFIDEHPSAEDSAKFTPYNIEVHN